MVKKYHFFLLFVVFSRLAISAEPIELNQYEQSLYGQFGEEGVLAKIFQLIEPSNRFCVECGAFDGITGSSTYLLRTQGWKCALFDRTYDIPQWSLHREFITSDNINSLLEQYKVPYDLDLLVITLGYNDYYIWQAIDPHYKPSVVLISYNPFFLPHEDKIVVYHPYYVGDNTTYYGASLLALFKLGQSKGYSLVHADKGGGHLFFIRNDLIDRYKLQFSNINSPKKIYSLVAIGSSPINELRKDPRNRGFLESEDLINPTMPR